MILGRTVDWSFLEERFGEVYTDDPGRPPLLLRNEHWLFLYRPEEVDAARGREVRNATRACCFLPESGFPSGRISDSNSVLENGGQHG